MPSLSQVNWLIHLLTGLKALVVADALFSWFLRPDRPPRSWTRALLEPLYAPLRRVLEPVLGSIDLAPLVALAMLYAAQLALRSASRGRPRAS